MKTKKEILEYYGKCCVSEYCICKNEDYPSGKEGVALARKDAAKLENILGQKKAIEFILEQTVNQ